ncbi:MAG: methyltransferase [Elusimicrobia bacterium]|nr:MAG: methyltransferase [Elusimicrobiota bacterium]KAF0157304.1 MAG: methyltransferase [Elusimicrobiota bacterium]
MTGEAEKEGRFDLLLVDDEEPPGEPDGSCLVYRAARWLCESPKLAVPLLSAYSKAAGHSVRTICFPLLPWREDEFRRLLSAAPKVVAVTTVAIFSPRYLARLTGMVRKLSPASLIVLGGHGAQDSREVRALGDVYISNHGEQALAELVSRVKAGLPPGKFPGAISRDGRVVIEGSYRYESFPKVLFPDWSAASTAAWRYPLEASRGCKFNCAYCGFPARAGQTYREVAGIIGEMTAVFREQGIRRFEFMDSSLTADTEFMSRLCAALRSTGIRFNWKCFARPDAFDRAPGLADEMAAAGCTRIFMGIESVHDPILSLMRRGMDRACIERGLDRVFKAGIQVHGNFIMGFPGETPATIKETARFVAARHFKSAYMCVFMMSEAMRAMAAAEPERYFHLAGTPVRGWRHDGMDFAEAARLTRRAVWKINLSRLWFVAFSPPSNVPDPVSSR